MGTHVEINNYIISIAEHIVPGREDLVFHSLEKFIRDTYDCEANRQGPWVCEWPHGRRVYHKFPCCPVCAANSAALDG